MNSWCPNSTGPLNITDTAFWSINDNDVCKDSQVGPTVWIVLEAVCFLHSFPSCIALVWELLQRYRTGSSSSTTDIFILNFAALGTMYSCSLVLDVLNMLIFRMALLKNTAMFSYSFSMTGVPLFITGICLDYYLAVVYPIVYMATKSLRSRVILCAIIWVYVTISGLLISCGVMPFNSPTCLFSYYITLTVSGFCNFSILRSLRKPGPGGQDLHHMKKRAFKTVLTIQVILVVCYLPPVLVFTFDGYMCKTSVEYHCVIAPAIMTFPTICCCVIPVLFLLSLGKLTCCQK